MCCFVLFSEPNFVGSYDIGSHVFFFFRETAVEYINCGKSVYSRVARVCKRDTGGKNILAQNWATYLKARLNCSIPGEFPFYFNEIREYRYMQHEIHSYCVRQDIFYHNAIEIYLLIFVKFKIMSIVSISSLKLINLSIRIYIYPKYDICEIFTEETLSLI